jgi:anti-anti-sigma factor
MNLKSERINGILVVAPAGRLDAYEAGNLSEELDLLIKAEDAFVVLDMAAIPYLSSGGIRVLLTTHKKMVKRNGRLSLSGLTEYPQQVLRMAGMDALFTTFNDVTEAVNQSARLKNMQQGEKELKDLPRYIKNQTGLQVYHASDRPATLKIVGSLMKVLQATLEPQDMRQRHFSEAEYSIGLGALGGSLDDCLPLLGEMMTAGGTMVWLPTDGNDTPDFLIPQKDTGQVLINTGLNMALEGEFNDVFLVGREADSAPLTLSGLYQAIFEIAQERKLANCSLVSVAMVADLEALYSSGVKISPVLTNTPANHGMITDQTNIGTWMDINSEPKFSGRVMVSFGVGLNLNSDYSFLSKAALDNVFYLHPSNTGSKKMLLHNHGVVFEPLQWEPVLDLDAEIRRIVRQGEFVDMRHLLDTTCLRRAVAGVSYISGIRAE